MKGPGKMDTRTSYLGTVQANDPPCVTTWAKKMASVVF
jgi:hypothetical protein